LSGLAAAIATRGVVTVATSRHLNFLACERSTGLKAVIALRTAMTFAALTAVTAVATTAFGPLAIPFGACFGTAFFARTTDFIACTAVVAAIATFTAAVIALITATVAIAIAVASITAFALFLGFGCGRCGLCHRRSFLEAQQIFDPTEEAFAGGG
jgi:hypothetical protein